MVDGDFFMIMDDVDGVRFVGMLIGDRTVEVAAMLRLEELLIFSALNVGVNFEDVGVPGTPDVDLLCLDGSGLINVEDRVVPGKPPMQDSRRIGFADCGYTSFLTSSILDTTLEAHSRSSSIFLRILCSSPADDSLSVKVSLFPCSASASLLAFSCCRTKVLDLVTLVTLIAGLDCDMYFFSSMVISFPIHKSRSMPSWLFDARSSTLSVASLSSVIKVSNDLYLPSDELAESTLDFGTVGAVGVQISIPVAGVFTEE